MCENEAAVLRQNRSPPAPTVPPQQSDRQSGSSERPFPPPTGEMLPEQPRRRSQTQNKDLTAESSNENNNNNNNNNDNDDWERVESCWRKVGLGGERGFSLTTLLITMHLVLSHSPKLAKPTGKKATKRVGVGGGGV